MNKNIFKSIEKRDVTIIFVTLIIGITLGSLFFRSSNNNPEERNHSQVKEAISSTYTCSMHPQIKKNEPGDCPICGMDLVPLNTISSDDDIDPDEIQMTQSAIKLADIQTYIVKQGTPEKLIHIFGKVKADERNIAQLTARYGGRIEKLYVNYKGQNVTKGQKLATIYSPNLITAQRELIEAVKYKVKNPSFYKATRSKLKLWDLSDDQINSIEKDGEPTVYFEIFSPISGTVTRRDVAVGDYVKEGNPLFEVIDLSNIWIMFDAYEIDLPWISIGDKIEFTMQSLPGKIYTAKVSYIDPFIDAKTRVAQVRVEMQNKDFKFKPEMFTKGILHSNSAKSSLNLLIPKTSVLWTGKRAVVYVKLKDREIPSFIFREIVLGPEVGNFYVVASGLEEGEKIASNGVFKIDASAQLAGKPSMMNPKGGKISTGHNHSETKMTDEEMAGMKKADKTTTSLSKDVSPKFKQQLGKVVNAYIIMKDKFVETDETQVEEKAKDVIATLNNVNMKILTDDAHDQWMKILKTIKDNLNGIINMKGIEMKRSHFSIVSNKLTEAVELFGISTDNSIYLEFCSMAFNNKGGFWISDEKQIKNPYFGDKMLKCGEVKKEFNKE